MIIRLNPNRESPFEKYACFTKTSFDGLSDALCEMALKNDVKIDPKFQEFVWFIRFLLLPLPTQYVLFIYWYNN